MVNLVNARFGSFEMRNLRGESVERPASVDFLQVFRPSFIVESPYYGRIIPYETALAVVIGTSSALRTPSPC